MRFALLALATTVMLTGLGCHHNLTQNSCGCNECGDGCSAGAGEGGHSRRPTNVAQLPQGYIDQQGPAGPPSASYGYPYYTTRSPRDFLVDNPASIGY